LIFKGKIKDERCPICKLELRDGQEILACPQCKTPFHENHLIQWMDSENSCPVCGEAYAIIVREKKIRTKKEEN
ncbi:MAG: RING finger protein, partial [Candidatus Heimdallarchaeota archaeon]